MKLAEFDWINGCRTKRLQQTETNEINELMELVDEMN